MISFRVDKFDFELPCVGPISGCHIEHDGSGAAPAWKLDKVTIEDVPRDHVYEFPVFRWLSKDKHDGAIDLDLMCPKPPTVEGPDGKWKGFDFKLPSFSMPSFHFKGRGKKPKVDLDASAEMELPDKPGSFLGMHNYVCCHRNHYLLQG